MSNNNSSTGQQQNQQQLAQQLAQQLFCAKAAYVSLTKKSRKAKTTNDHIVVFNDVFQLVNGNSQADFIDRAPLILKEINNNLGLRKIYRQLITQFKFAESGLQAAASSAETSPNSFLGRTNEQFSLKFKRDKSNPRQVYVILMIHHPAEHHLSNTVAMHISKNEQADCLYFPILIDGRSQLLLEEEDIRFQLITDCNSHLFLM